MEKYQDWSKVLIEPTSLNDARLFALESRLHEEEEIRIKKFGRGSNSIYLWDLTSTYGPILYYKFQFYVYGIGSEESPTPYIYTILFHYLA